MQLFSWNIAWLNCDRIRIFWFSVLLFTLIEVFSYDLVSSIGTSSQWDDDGDALVSLISCFERVRAWFPWGTNDSVKWKHSKILLYSAPHCSWRYYAVNLNMHVYSKAYSHFLTHAHVSVRTRIQVFTSEPCESRLQKFENIAVWALRACSGLFRSGAATLYAVIWHLISLVPHGDSVKGNYADC